MQDINRTRALMGSLAHLGFMCETFTLEILNAFHLFIRGIMLLPANPLYWTSDEGIGAWVLLGFFATNVIVWVFDRSLNVRRTLAFMNMALWSALLAQTPENALYATLPGLVFIGLVKSYIYLCLSARMQSYQYKRSQVKT